MRPVAVRQSHEQVSPQQQQQQQQADRVSVGSSQSQRSPAEADVRGGQSIERWFSASPPPQQQPQQHQGQAESIGDHAFSPRAADHTSALSPTPSVASGRLSPTRRQLVQRVDMMKVENHNLREDLKKFRAKATSLQSALDTVQISETNLRARAQRFQSYSEEKSMEIYRLQQVIEQKGNEVACLQAELTAAVQSAASRPGESSGAPYAFLVIFCFASTAQLTAAKFARCVVIGPQPKSRCAVN